MSADLILPAPAKLNLGLRVLRRRFDGFHDLAGAFQTLALADEITFEPISGTPETVCGHPQVPTGEDDLAGAAMAAFYRRWPAAPSYRIRLRKRLPIGGGLGGGSSDAAAVLRGLRRLHDRDTSHAEIAEIAAGLGADVSFFLVGGSAWVEGRGEAFTPLDDLEGPPLTLVLPPFGVATGACFAALSQAERGPRPAPDPDAWCAGWRRRPGDCLGNDLTPAACRVEPRLAPYLDWLADLDLPAGLSGSGSTCYVLGELTECPLPARLVRTRFRRRDELDAVVGGEEEGRRL